MQFRLLYIRHVHVTQYGRRETNYSRRTVPSTRSAAVRASIDHNSRQSRQAITITSSLAATLPAGHRETSPISPNIMHAYLLIHASGLRQHGRRGVALPS